MTVKFLDLQYLHAPIRQELDDAVRRVVESGWYVLGPEVEAFEDEWARYVGASYCVSLGNGLDALTLALRAFGVGPADEVIVPSHTFVATWLAVAATGATPVPVEVDPSTFNLDASAIAAAITARTRAVLPVHLYGHPFDSSAIGAVADEFGIPVIEDAAQAHGAVFRGTRVGGHGRTACWSFYPGKNLGALGDAGAVTTDDPALARSIRLLRNYGSAQKYVHEQAGVNSRCDELQAAILRVKLRHLDAWNDHRITVANQYKARLEGMVSLPELADGATSVWHNFVVRVANRDSVVLSLREQGIETLIHYPTPPHLQAAFSTSFSATAYPVATTLAAEVLSLPIGCHIDERAVSEVATALRLAT